MNNKAKGIKGETQAECFLSKRGYEILEKNYREGRGEIDLIGLYRNELLVFVEVKFRKNSLFGEPETFVSKPQQDRIMETAEGYIHAINWKKDIRFDILSIAAEAGEIRHFKDAFH